MKQNDEININLLPAKTWYWLRMNETGISWNRELTPCRVDIEGDKVLNLSDSQLGAMDLEVLKTIETGSGKEADSIFNEIKEKAMFFKANEANKNKTLHVSVDGEGKASTAGALYVEAEENSDIRMIETFKQERREPGSLAFRTVIHAKKNSHVRLIQVYMQGEEQNLLNDVGCLCEENAQFELIQIFIGKGNLYNGIRTDLKGKGSNTHQEIGYLGQKAQVIDINLIVNHFGKKTNSLIQVEGTLKDAAEKIFRGSIDFKKGASEAKGAETENVLLLGDDVINKTIPLILCAEEDVEGSHGATIGELDEETLFYFETKGMDKEAAEKIMTQGKLEMLYRHIQDEQTQNLVEQQLTEVMKGGRE